VVVVLVALCNVPISRAGKALRSGQLDNAKALVRQAVRLNLAFFPLTFRTTLFAFDVQIRLLLTQSRFVEVEALASVLLIAYRRFRLLKVGHSIEVTLRNYVALAYLGEGRYLDAETLFAEVLEGTKNPLAKAVLLNNVGYCQLELGNIDESHKSLSAAVAHCSQRTSQEKLIFLSINANLARACVQKSLLAEAEARIESGLELAESIKAPAYQIGGCYEAFADLRFAQERYEEAEHHFRNAIDMMQTVLSETHPTIIRVTNRLAQLLEKQGKTNEAHDLFVKAARNEEALQQYIKDSTNAICQEASLKKLPLIMV
jgi:tetratricopeptide (TPR) repeat protein